MQNYLQKPAKHDHFLSVFKWHFLFFKINYISLHGHFSSFLNDFFDFFKLNDISLHNHSLYDFLNHIFLKKNPMKLIYMLK